MHPQERMTSHPRKYTEQLTGKHSNSYRTTPIHHMIDIYHHWKITFDLAITLVRSPRPHQGPARRLISVFGRNAAAFK